ncbi:MAG TPA: NUDIX domain-containing protein [Dehalococcoidia bacterium]|nr:NUDIX domain-containing protein [Dehalococcoidia bacterium]
MTPARAKPSARSPRAKPPAGRPVAVLVVIFTVDGGRLQVLLIRRSAEPFKDAWSLPGGLLATGESLQEAAVRKLADETGLADVFLEQLYTFSDLDSQGSIAVAYFALVDVSEALLAQRSEWLPAWFPVAELPELAFKNDEVITYAQQRLRAKLDYSNVAYSLLPEEFTLSQLQATYEAIHGRPMDKRNFRKRVVTLALVEPTGRRAGSGRHRPAQLYRFRERHPVVF